MAYLADSVSLFSQHCGFSAYSATMTDASPRSLVRAQVALESFRLTPDGSHVVYALRRVRRGEYESHLWIRPYRGGRARQLTRGRVRDGSPEVSPDGRLLAFVRTPVGDFDGHGQVWIPPLDGGEPWRLTSLPHGASSADGRRLALVAPGGSQRFIIGEERKDRPPTARRLTRLDFRVDESGHVGRRAHLWVVDAREGAQPRQLTRDDFDVLHPAWSRDGKLLACERGIIIKDVILISEGKLDKPLTP